MNAAEIASAVEGLFAEPLDPAGFPYAFLQAFGNKETTLKKLRTGDTNKSDMGGVLQRNQIHLAVAAPGQASETLAALRETPATAKHKVKFILATDGERIEAEELGGGTPLECAWSEFPDHFGFFLPLAGISTVREIRENAFDIRATSKLNRLYVELLKENPDWGTDQRRPAMNHFMARLIFSFFAEDTGIFADDGLFTKTVAQMSEKDSSNTHEVIGSLFLAMNTRHDEREAAGLPRWASKFPYVNGGLFSGDMAVPRFSRTARSYLLQVGSLDWKQINPDIFGSMIQAVASDEERGDLGMHYTSVPNILKVLNPLFLDDLRAKLEEAGKNPRKLLNLRNRIKRIRVFDPACGSGNFLVIAYKEMRGIEAEINKRRGEADRASEIPLENFRGIELRDFAAEIARLALIIAEFQCDVRYRGERLALAEFLPLDGANWITNGNALHLDWLLLWPTGTKVKYTADDLFETALEQPDIDFATVGGETYICGNPPYLGSTWQSKAQKDDLKAVFNGRVRNWKLLDYVAGWFLKAADYNKATGATTAFVATNSICQGQQVPALWPAIFATGNEIAFAHTSFKWSNLASHKAGVTVVIVGLSTTSLATHTLYSAGADSVAQVREVERINAYLVPGNPVWITSRSAPATGLFPMTKGDQPTDGGFLLLARHEVKALGVTPELEERIVRSFLGSAEFVRGTPRYCLWVDDAHLSAARVVPAIRRRFDAVAEMRRQSPKAATRAAASTPYRFGEIRRSGNPSTVVVPSVSSESRTHLPVGFVPPGTVISNLAFALYDAPLWNMALIASKLHLVWIATVCGKLKTDFRYSNTLGWNTFPVPPLTEQNKADLTQCAEEILLAREAHYPATIADLYRPDKMPANLREAHERNDEVLERIYIGRRFRNDTERLEKLFEMYTKMTANEQRPAKKQRKRG
jgi:hypothetical protein